MRAYNGCSFPIKVYAGHKERGYGPETLIPVGESGVVSFSFSDAKTFPTTICLGRDVEFHVRSGIEPGYVTRSYPAVYTAGKFFIVGRHADDDFPGMPTL